MKKAIMLLCIAILIFGMTGLAGAIKYEYDPDDFLMKGRIFGSKDSESGKFEIPDDQFDPTEQDITSATIEFWLKDDGGRRDFWEFAKINVGPGRFHLEVDEGAVSRDISSLTSLNERGFVDWTVTALWGDFFFEKVVFNAEFTKVSTGGMHAPEPSTIFLVGAGLLALVKYGRNRSFRRV